MIINIQLPSCLSTSKRTLFHLRHETCWSWSNGSPQITDADMVVNHKDVVGLDIPMSESHLMQMLDTLTDLSTKDLYLRPGQCTRIVFQVLGQCLF